MTIDSVSSEELVVCGVFEKVKTLTKLIKQQESIIVVMCHLVGVARVRHMLSKFYSLLFICACPSSSTSPYNLLSDRDR